LDSFAAGMEFQRLLERFNRHEAECLAHRIEHETNPGAHAAAFDGHGLSPGIVEEAEKTAEAILETAMDTLQEAAEVATSSVAEAGEAAVSSLGEATASVGKASGEAAESVAGGASNILPLADEGPKKPIPERTPHRPHPMHRNVSFRRK
jgi:hypothetical protein